MNKAIIAIGVVIAIIALSAFLILRQGSVATGLLYIDGPDVEVDAGSGWQKATDEMELRVGSAIRTGADTATVVLLEGELIILEPNTEISLAEVSKKAIKITQRAGETLNKITKLSGIQSYTVESPSTVATVRGTTFFYSDEEVTVEDGEVGYGPKADPNKLGVRAGKKSNKNGFSLIDLDERDRAKFERMRARQINALSRVREREIQKHQTVLKFADARGVNEQKRRELLKQIDEDQTPAEDKALAQVPGPLKSTADRTYRLTKEIKKVRAARQTTTGPAPATIGNCRLATGCRTYDAECGGKGSERLFVDAQYQRCVDATKAAVEGVQYCGRTTLAMGDRACSYMTNDAIERGRCLCPAHA